MSIVKVTVELKQVSNLSELNHLDKNGNPTRSIGKDFFMKNTEGEFECYHVGVNTTKEQLELYLQRGAIYIFNPNTIDWNGKIKPKDNHAC